MARTPFPATIVLAVLGAGYASSSPDRVSVQARGAFFSPAVLQALVYALEEFGEEGYSSREYDDEEYEWTNLTHRSHGWRVALHTDVVDLVGGRDEHWFDDRRAKEVAFGLRKRILGSDPPFYAQVLWRHGKDLATDHGREDYDGFSAGVGWLLPLDEHWFVDFAFTYECLLDKFEFEDDDRERLMSFMVELGIGARF